MIKTLPSNAEGAGSIPVGGAKILQASQPKKPEHKIQKKYCNKLNKDFKNGPLKKILKNHNEIPSHTNLDGYY